jgi:hypothetical protein
MTRLGSLHLPGIAFVSLLVAACAPETINDVACPDSTTFRRPISPAPTVGALAAPETRDPAAGSYEGAIVRALLSAPRAREALPTDRTRRRIAVLSGGGQYGAYGAGFLEAWRRRGGEDIEFTVVTGISTGALQSTLVFLGEDADSANLVDAYSIEDEEELAKKRASFFGIPLKNSIYSLAPARTRIEKYMTAERIRRVAKAANQNRTLLVGVVDAREGGFYAFDLTALAASDMDEQIKRRCYVEALMASAAVPVVFPPVYLDGHQYYDGGVRASVFLDSTVNALDRLAAKSPIAADIYLVFNGYLEIEPDPDLENSILATLLRTKDITFDQIERFSVQSVLRLGDRYDVRWTRIPSRLCLEAQQNAPDEDVFNAPFMACLIEEGGKAGSEPHPWMQP